jgi:hypothetical protein
MRLMKYEVSDASSIAMYVAQPPAGRKVADHSPFITRYGSPELAETTNPMEFLAMKRSGVLQSSQMEIDPLECRNQEEPLRAFCGSLWPVSFATQAASRNCPAPKSRCPLRMWSVTASSNSLERTSVQAEANVRLTHRGRGHEGFYLSSERGFSIREGGLPLRSRRHHVCPLPG